MVTKGKPCSGLSRYSARNTLHIRPEGKGGLLKEEEAYDGKINRKEKNILLFSASIFAA